MDNDTLQNKKRPIRLLLVEDNYGDALLVKHAFVQTKIKNCLTIAQTGEEALTLLYSNDTPDIILLDLNLPGIKGLEVLKAIKYHEQLKRIPVIILSSSRADNDVFACYNNYANCYMMKAATLHELYRLVDRVEQFWFKQVILPHPETKP